MARLIPIVAFATICFAVAFTSIRVEGAPASVDACEALGTDRASNSGEIVSFDAGARTISAVCIKSGAQMFVTTDPDGKTSSGHSGPLGNGSHEGGCYQITGVGTSFVTVVRDSRVSSPCQGIGHMDVIFVTPTEPPTATATQTPIPSTSTPTATATLTPTATPTGTQTPAPTPTATPTPPAAPPVIIPEFPEAPLPSPTPTRTSAPAPTVAPPPIIEFPTRAAPAVILTATNTPTPLSRVLGQAITQTPTRTSTPTATPTAMPTGTPTSPPRFTPTAMPAAPTMASVPPGFLRVELPRGTGYRFELPGTATDDFDIFWNGSEIIARDGTTISGPFNVDDPRELAGAPRSGYRTGSVIPQPGAAYYVRSDDRVYLLWIPPGQELGQANPLTFDWTEAAFVSEPGAALPGALEDINSPLDIFAGGTEVAATNLTITLAILLLLLAGGAMFNEALEENVRGWRVPVHVPKSVGSTFGSLGSTFSAIGAWFAALIPGNTWLDHSIGPALLLVLTGLIYSLLEPGFGLNDESVTLFLSLVVSQGVLVVCYEGGKAWLYRRSLRVDAGLRLFPACILIALVSVGISRLGGFQPGFVVGFVASAVVLGDPNFSAQERGKAWAGVAAVMLGVSVIAWLAAIPLRELSESSTSVWAALPESIALSIFVVCLQGLLFNLMPLEFMDGWRIWKWKPIAWVALFVPSAFLFTQVLFNDDEGYIDLISSHKSLTGVAILLAYLAITFGTWLYLKRRSERNRPTGPVAPGVSDAGP